MFNFDNRPPTCKNSSRKSNVSIADPVKDGCMEAFKAITVILLAAAVEFAAVVIYNNKTIPAFEAKIIQANQAGAAEVMKQAAIRKSSPTPGAAAHKQVKGSNL